MPFNGYKSNRVRSTNDKPFNSQGEYILYWMQANRRLESNHSLDYAIELSIDSGKPLVIYEGLRKDYQWNSHRLHKFIMEGMCDNLEDAEKLDIPYWCYVETDINPAQGLLKKIAKKAAAIVTDDFPCFIIPEQIRKLSSKVDCPLYAIDGNGLIPLVLYGTFASAARVVRTRMHKLFPEAYIHKAKSKYTISDLRKLPRNKELREPPFISFSGKREDLGKTIKDITFTNQIEPYEPTVGGRKEGLKILHNFLETKLEKYGTERSQPNSPDKTPASLLSPYLHFGHISSEEVIREVLNRACKDGQWAPDLLNPDYKGKRELFFSSTETVNSYLDELITWRDTGYQWFWQKPEFRKGLSELPGWIQDNFTKHKKDKRDYKYTIDEWRYGKTHDPIWNAAQNELRITGRMHNYMRMLWGKKVIEWSPTIEDAYNILEEFNNLYAYDGRNPNSYTGILWCFGMFDRPWFPERNVLGNIRYMSSDSTKKKFKLESYLNYVNGLTNKQGNLF